MHSINPDSENEPNLIENSLYYSDKNYRSQKSEILFEHTYIYEIIKHFLDIIFKRLNVMKIYMYSLYVYISRKLQ